MFLLLHIVYMCNKNALAAASTALMQWGNVPTIIFVLEMTDKKRI